MDAHGHLIVKHDLFNHDGLTQDGIAEAFIEFAKKENLSFFDCGLSGSKNLTGLYAKHFDEVKYRALLERLEISEVVFSKLNNETRLDAEYFKNENLLLDTILKEHKTATIGEFSYVTDGIHTAIDYCGKSRVNLISATSPKENIFDLSRQVFISEDAHSKNPRTALKKGDVIVSTVGTIGNCAVVDESVLPANSDRHVGIIRIEKDFLPYFLSTFLLTKYGKFQTLRESTGNVQLNLFLYKIRELIVPCLAIDFQEVIKVFVKNAHLKLEQSKSTYAQAENLLLNTLGIANFSLSSENINIKSFKDSFVTTGRLDSEYYQPKYDELIANIKHFPHKTLSAFIEIYSTGYPYKSEDYLENSGVPLIRINNIKKGFLDISNTAYLPIEQMSISQNDIAAEGDILLSMSGTIGNTCVIPKGVTALINQRIMRFTPKNYNPLVLMLMLNSIVGELQLERIGTGGVQTNISSNDISKIIVPILPDETQNRIANLIQQSFTLKAESERLLATAKRAVEIAIETDEQTAMVYINEQTGEKSCTPKN